MNVSIKKEEIMPKLGVNVDHVATVRQARRVKEPDPIIAATIAELAGADSIVVHLREDRRHIQERDVRILRQIVTTKLNLEMAATDAMVKFALSLKPDQATLVPERREELTTEGGLNVIENKDHLSSVVNLLQDAGIIVSLFIDPEIPQIKACAKMKVNAIELHTGNYANADTAQQAQKELERLEDATSFGLKQGLIVNAGHGLNYQNVVPVASIHGIEELNIGHSIVARAILVGMDEAVREMLELVRSR
jgi:pyridoxine 5-phosphate synthase